MNLSLDAKSFAETGPSISRNSIAENEVNCLTFPNAENSMVLFGLDSASRCCAALICVLSRREPDTAG